MKTLDIAELNKLYDDAKSIDKEITAEMRSNILLIAGEHYSKRLNDTFQRNRVQGQTQDPYQLRITKNWLHRAHRIYVNAIINQAPGVTVVPRNATELQDQKSAELNESVWQYAKDKYKLRGLIRELASDFCGIGEACVKIFFDPYKGALKGYEQQVDEETGEPVFDEFGQPVADEEKPVFSGEFVFERVYGQNIFRDPSAVLMRNCKWIGIEKIDSTSSLKKRYENDPEKSKAITDSTEDFIIFDTAKSGYGKNKDQTVIREYYWKPCQEYPEGYFVIATKAGILEEGPLPFGIFPIAWCGFDEYATKVRATSIVKVARPWQAEINRASSQAALHSITIGEDKILYQSGTNVTQGSLLPGVRGITYQGQTPTILPGRTGEQFFEYIALQEQEMNRALMMDIIDEEKIANLDPMAMLFRSMNQSQKFSFYSDKFGGFLIEMVEIYLEQAKHYLEGDELIAAIGKSELINIEEFKSTTPLQHRITVEEQSETIETKLGKQLVLNQILQYSSAQLTRDDVGKLVTEMPFGNWEQAFSDFTIDYQNYKNDFLAIERGQMPNIAVTDNSEYCLKQVAKRKKERDFVLLPDVVKALYDQYEQIHEQKMAEEAAAMKQAQSEFIPTGGAMVAADMYVPDSDPTKAPKRVRIPYQSLDWLLKNLERQGMGMNKIEEMNQAQFAEVAGMLQGGGAQQGIPPGV